MARLIEDAAKLDKSIDANDMSFGNIVKSINAVQKEMGIYGTTAKEASATISGSLAAVKAQWNNLLTAVSQGDDWDLGVYISNFVDTVSTAFNNLMPVVQKSLVGIAELISQLAPIIVEKLPEVVNDVVPALIGGATSMVNSIVAVLPDLLNTVVEALIQNAPALIVAAVALVEQLATGVLNMLPDILQLGIDLIFVLLDGITKMIDDPAFIQTIVDVVLKMVDILTNPDTITKLLDAALAIMIALGEGIVIALPQLLKKIPEIIKNLVDGFKNSKIYDIGKNIVEGIKSGISNAWKNLKKWFKNLFGDLIGIAKKILGIRSPSRVFRDQIGKQMAAGLGLGWEDEFGKVKSDIEDSLDFDDASVGINASIRKVGAGAVGGALGGTTFNGDIIINVNGDKYHDENALAEALAVRLQGMTDRRVAVFANG